VDPIVEQAHNNNVGKSILVQIHPSSSGDIFYNSRMGGRLSFYNAFNLFYGYPTLIIDGLKEPTYPYSVSRITNEIDNRRSVETPITIATELSKSTGKSNKISSIINYKTTVSSEKSINSSNLRLLVFIVESNIVYSAPNGSQIHNHVALDIYPDENGIPIDFTNGNDLSHVFEGSIDVTITNELKNHSIVAIVQDFETGEVYQAIELTYDQYLNSEEEKTNSPLDFRIDNVFPNPFNPVTNIAFSIKEDSPISLHVYNLKGEQVDTIKNSERYTPGSHVVQWNASDHPSGTYILQLISPEGIKIKKSILLK